MTVDTISVALAHDYLTQRGGAERVAAAMAQAFPEAPLYTTLYDHRGTFDHFNETDVRVSPLNRSGLLRRHHRLALPLLAPTVSSTFVTADVLLTSSSGWAHGIRTSGRKIVYCHAPARWLYQRDRYLGLHTTTQSASHLRDSAQRAALSVLTGPLRRWDARAAGTAHRYLVNSTVTRDAVRVAYGIEAEVIPPPPALLPFGREDAPGDLEPGYVLCVARLLPYKNVDILIRAVRKIPRLRLIVVGDGPQRRALEELRGGCDRLTLLGSVSDEQLRWLYRHCSAVVSASYEDYGLSPLEAASFGRPAVVMRAGGFLDTVIDGRTGVFFDEPVADHVARALENAAAQQWDEQAIRTHAASFSIERFQTRLRHIVSDEISRRH